MDQSLMEDVSKLLRKIRPEKDLNLEDLGPDLGLRDLDLLNQHSVHFLLVMPGNVQGVACKIFQNAGFVIIATPKSLYCQMMKKLLTQVYYLLIPKFKVVFTQFWSIFSDFYLILTPIFRRGLRNCFTLKVASLPTQRKQESQNFLAKLPLICWSPL
jgi:hypothetical protein